ncbi:flagellar motor stator protein MotA [Bacillus alkalicellulosilyticus]|uniref:flagellar motor stator protein MotA n=1 Tax=Alkalihalobacterium alkalicellulosilyticum TaxID=1912214 RepID=UPI0009966569|nr:flagellar motor stator protein MotA [Bacillus alkalicellulosilyticus]
MDKNTIIGVVLGVLSLTLGMVFKGTSLGVLWNPAAITIIMVGTVAAVMIAFPTEDMKKVPKLFSILFKDKADTSIPELVERFVEFATVSRQEGMLALESKLKDIQDPFLNQAIRMVADGLERDVIRHSLTERIDAMQQRHATGAQIFTQAGTYAPTLGVLGAVLGLIAALGNMNDIDALGYAISAAFVATLYGIFTGYVLWHPFANKLKQKSKKEVIKKYLIVEGTVMIINGVSPREIEETLSGFLEEKEQQKLGDRGEA